MHMGAVATSDVKRVLRPLALAGKHATARMVAGRIVAILEWAEVENLREPAGSGRAIVETVMRSLPKAAAVRHHRALHFARGGGAAQGGRPCGHRARGKTGDPVRGADGGADELLSEFALAHVEGSKTVAAYARDDLLEKWRPVMQRWADFIDA